MYVAGASPSPPAVDGLDPSRPSSHGPYAPWRGEEMSRAYASALHLTFEVKAGLLMRQTHHWAANVFIVAIVLHAVFFTGAFRKPRDLTYIVGVTLLALALLEGYLGYSLLDDLLSGMGRAIGYAVVMSVPPVVFVATLRVCRSLASQERAPA
jgi:ubiquinol-cytochrome c reductase cytochrome b subunit